MPAIVEAELADDVIAIRAEMHAVAKIAEFSAYVRHLEIKLEQDSAALAHQLRNLEADLAHKKAEWRANLQNSTRFCVPAVGD